MELTSKREPFDTQLTALTAIADRQRYILLGEPGSGKSLVLVNDLQARYRRKEIESVVIAVPALNMGDWKNEHLPNDMTVPYQTFVYSAFTTKKKRTQYDLFRAFPGLRILLVSNETLSIGPHQQFVEAYLKKYRCMLIIDEVHDYASPESKRTAFVTGALYHAIDEAGEFLPTCVLEGHKRKWSGVAHGMKHLAKVVGVATGTLFTQNPMSLWASQKLMDFNTETVTAFRSKYMLTMLDATPAGVKFQRILTRKEIEQVRSVLEKKDGAVEETAASVGITVANVRAISETTGNLPYKNMKSLKETVDKWAVRMPLPESARIPVIPVNVFVPMTKEQKSLTTRIISESLALIEDKGVTVTNALNIHLRLSQISSGFLPVNIGVDLNESKLDEGYSEYPDFDRMIELSMDPIAINERSPKQEAVLQLIEDLGFKRGDKPMLISCLFRVELAAMVNAIHSEYPSLRIGVIQGGMTSKEREELLFKFNNGEIDIIVLNERAGRGLNLQKADKLVIVSSSPSADRRKQLIARIKRAGQLASILRVWHILSERSIDIKIESVLKQITTIAEYINNDAPLVNEVKDIGEAIEEYLKGVEIAVTD